jgi:hypothetical protein
MDVSRRILRIWMPAIHAGTTELRNSKILLHTRSSIGTEFVMNMPSESTSEGGRYGARTALSPIISAWRQRPSSGKDLEQVDDLGLSRHLANLFG